ncbi:MAG: peptidoglycan-binding domain-containing protein [Patescibacteria group bacterium]
MKKVLITTGVAILTFASIAGAQSLTFGANLNVGSTGPDVATLQTWLISHGFTIPSIANGTASKGTFGSQTRAAVQKYQTSKGIPSTGFVGPLTRGALNGSSISTPAVSAGTCPPGYNCTLTGSATPSPAVANPGSITTPGVAGTLSFSLQSTPSNGTSVDKGSSADIARYKLQAGASDMQVTSLSLDFDVRFWLYATSITIKDDSGAVVATKSGLSQADFTELTAGSSYRLYVPLNYIVQKSGTRYFTVNVSFLPITDRPAATVSITQAQVRSVDGTGVTDTQTDATDRSFRFTGSNNGVVVITNNENSPPNMLVTISTSAETKNIVMGVADFKSQGKDGMLRSMTLYVNTNVDATRDINTIFNDIKLKIGDLVYSANSIEYGGAAGSTVTFTNMNAPLPADTKVPVAVLVDVAKDTNNSLDGIVASSTLVASGTAGASDNNPMVEDSTFASIDINDAPLATSDITFSASDANLFSEAPTAVLGSPLLSGNTTSTYAATFTFALTAGDNTIYMSKNPVVALSTTSTGYDVSASPFAGIVDVTANPGSISGDSATYFTIPAGSTRKFVWNGSIRTSGVAGLKTLSITSINYGTTTTNVAATGVVYYNYAALKVAAPF